MNVIATISYRWSELIQLKDRKIRAIDQKPISDAFIFYLHERLNKSTLQKLCEDEEFISLSQYPQEFEYLVFHLLVNLSVSYLKISIQEVLFDFNIYCQSMENKERVE
ncbi:MAG: hypothetical protein ACXAD7_18460 [Candidatus Kariarchaeaceae archaeon]|jgi:hypothetical protein